MNRKVLFSIFMLAALVGLAVAPTLAQDEFVFGVILVGPKNDRGWSQAHFEGGEYVEANIGAEMLLFESLNPADAPETTLRDVVTEMADEGAQLIITTSDSFTEDTDIVAEEFPDIIFINSSGETVQKGIAPDNVGNVMGQMIWGKEMAGCTAALSTETGKIGYLGPLINNETRRLAASAYLGAQYCYENYAGGNPEDLEFSVTWIGFWFNIPGVTLDPTEEVNTLFDSGADVVISGIDTTEALDVAGQRAGAGEPVMSVGYDYSAACDIAPEVCLGVPYYNWGPAYLEIVQSVIDGEWEQAWDWLPPNWEDINNADSSAIGFLTGPALSEEATESLDAFIAEQAAFVEANDGFFLWEGPLTLQDGTIFADDGQIVDIVDIWYLGQLLDGMIGASE